MHSKFGTRLSMEKDSSYPMDTRNANNSDTDDETDDERPTSTTSSQLSAVPIHFPNSSLVTKTLEKNGSVVIESLTLREGSQIKDNYALVQVGNALFKVTRIRLEFCLSRLQPKEKKELEGLGEIIGANITSTFDCDSITHLVSPDKSSTAKSISAWALNIPTVTSDFIRAHANRKNMKDPLPQVTEYEAPPGLSRIENDATPLKRRKLLEGYKVLSLMWSEGEMMCKCTGATVVPLYRTASDGKMDLKFWQNDEFSIDLKRQQEKDRLVVVWLDSASKKLKKGRDYLVRVMHELEKEPGKFQMNCINQNGIARAISYASNLTDVDEKTLVPLKTCGDAENEDESDRAHPRVSKETKPVECEEFHQQEVLGDCSTSSVVQSQPKTAVNKSLDVTTEREEILQGNDVSANSKRSSGRNKVSFPSQQKRKEKSTMEGQSGWIKSTKSKSVTVGDKGVETRHSESDNVDYTTAEINPNDDGHTQTYKSMQKSRLSQTQDGWFCAAPQGKERECYKRPLAECNEMGDINVRSSAQTEYCDDLVVRPKQSRKRIAHEVQMNSTNANSEKVKDFKRFKKNPIIAGAKMHSISQIPLISVLPKESERQRELENMQLDLEREQLVADALFSGEGGKSRKGIQNYFQPTPKSRGRVSTRGRA